MTDEENRRTTSSEDSVLGWSGLPPSAEIVPRNPLGAVAPPAVLAALLALLGWWIPALLVTFATVVLQVLARFRPAVHDRIIAAIARMAVAIARGLGFVLLTAVFVGLVVPVSAVARLLGNRSLLASGPESWSRRAPDEGPMTLRTFALDPGRPAPGRLTPWSVFRVAPVLIGWVTIAAVVNFGLGYAWDALVGEEATTAAAAVAAGEADPRAETPAFADVPWAEDYLAELKSIRYEYLPFIVTRMRAFDGRFTSGDGGVRHSAQAVTEGEDVPVVWFFGGSTMWGEGQRDAHTIPSEIARLASEAGTPIRVLNFGERGYVSRQELELFDRELGLRPAPDLAVFYDGSNDVNVQRPHFNEAEYLDGAPIVYGVGELDEVLHTSPGSGSGIYEWYVRRSLLHELVDGVRDLFGDREAGATPSDDDGVVERATAVYKRTRALIQTAARDAGVDLAFFWQPDRGSFDPDEPMRRVARAVGPPTIDLSDAIPASAADAVYIDGGHTNERGARFVAEAMWEHLAPTVRGLSLRR